MKEFKIFFKPDPKKGFYSRVIKGFGNESYYNLIREEEVHGGKQFIITEDMMKHLITKYVLEFKHDLIEVETDERDINNGLKEYISKMQSERGYLVKVLEVFDKATYINSVTLKKYDEIIKIKSNGIISTNTVISKELLDLLWKFYTSEYRLIPMIYDMILTH